MHHNVNIYGIYLTSYIIIRYRTHLFHREPTTIEKMPCGALSGLLAQTLAYPLDVTRRQMQTIGIVPTSGSESAAINLMGVSKLKHQVDELPEAVEQSAQSAKERNIPKNSPSVNETLNKTTSAANQLRQQHKPPSMLITMQHLFEEQGIVDLGHGFAGEFHVHHRADNLNDLSGTHSSDPLNSS